MDKTKKKGRSITSKLNSMREHRDNLAERVNYLSNIIKELRYELSEYKLLVPFKFYGIEFSGVNKFGHVTNTNETIASISPRLAIEKLKEKYKEFKFISIKQLTF